MQSFFVVSQTVSFYLLTFEITIVQKKLLIDKIVFI